jgi:hypothetical protein
MRWPESVSMNTPLYTRRRLVLAAVRAELDCATRLEDRGNAGGAFGHLERAHVLGQHLTETHVRVHREMLRWALRHRRPREAIGQLTRIAGAATKTALGWVPRGNTGGANVSPFRRMPIPDDLQRQIDRFRTEGAI